MSRALLAILLLLSACAGTPPAAERLANAYDGDVCSERDADQHDACMAEYRCSEEYLRVAGSAARLRCTRRSGARPAVARLPDAANIFTTEDWCGAGEYDVFVDEAGREHRCPPEPQ